MNFLIIGGSSFIGSHITASLHSLGHEVTATYSRPTAPGLLKFNLLHDRILDCVPKDFFQAEVFVVITAAMTDMDACQAEPELARKVNVEKTIQLIKEVTDAGARVVFLSSTYVFDGEIGYYNESSPRSPANKYGEHKALVEDYLTANVSDAFIPRLDKVVGIKSSTKHLLADWYKSLKYDGYIQCLEGSLIAPTYVGDVARAIGVAANNRLTGVYHVCNSEFFYREELARQFCRAVGFVNAPILTRNSIHLIARRSRKSYLDGSHFTGEMWMPFCSMSEVFRNFEINAALTT